MGKLIAQKRAADAFKKVNELTSRYNDEWQAKYASYVKSLPATILMNGLGQAAATLLARAKGNKEDPHYVLYAHLESWLCENNGDLMATITNNDRHAYVQAQVEALAWLEWLKKFATAYLKQREGEG